MINSSDNEGPPTRERVLTLLAEAERNFPKAKIRLGKMEDFARSSNRTYGYVNTGALIADAAGQGLAICPLDHGIMSVGEKGIYTIDPDYVPTTPVAQVSLFNNLWTINFPYWIQGTIRSRVRVWATHDLEPASLVVPALDALTPVLAAVADGSAGTLPTTAQGLAVSRPGVRLTCFSQNRDGAGTMLRVWEQAGEAGEVTVTFPKPCPYTEAQPVNLRNEPVGKALPVTGGGLTFNLGPYAPASFILLPELPSVAPSGAGRADDDR